MLLICTAFLGREAAEFSAQRVSGDGGALLLREADRKIHLLDRLTYCFSDGRAPLLVRHQLSEMLAQRIYGLALGYEDLNDHEQLRSDPLLGLLAVKRELDEPLAGRARRGPAASATGRCTNDSRTREEHPSYKLGSMPVNSVGPPA